MKFCNAYRWNLLILAALCGWTSSINTDVERQRQRRQYPSNTFPARPSNTGYPGPNTPGLNPQPANYPPGYYPPGPFGAGGGNNPIPSSGGGYIANPGTDGFNQMPYNGGGYPVNQGSGGGFNTNTGSGGGFNPNTGSGGGFNPNPINQFPGNQACQRYRDPQYSGPIVRCPNTQCCDNGICRPRGTTDNPNGYCRESSVLKEFVDFDPQGR